MKKVLPLLFSLLCFLFFFEKINAQCVQDQLPTTDCNIAPTVCPSSGALDQYCGTNDNFNFDPNLQPPNFCGTLQNPDWIGFIPMTSNVSLHLYVENCISNGLTPALQAMVFKGCEYNWEPASDCFYEIFTNTSQIIPMNNLEPGAVYYLLIDGFSGAICDYFLEVEQGQLSGYADAQIADAGSDVPMVCNQPVLLDGSNSTFVPESIFTWRNQSGVVVGTGMTYLATEPGTYTLTITDPFFSICPSQDQVSVFPVGVTTLELGDGTYLDCNSGETIIEGEHMPLSADYSYSWTTINGTIAAGGNTATPLVSAPGDYVLTILDLINNCSAFDTITVYNWEDVLTVDSLFHRSCSASGNVNLTAATLVFESPNFTFAWTTNDGNIVSNANKLVPRINELGVYNIVFTDTVSGCFLMDEVTVVDTFPPAIPIIDFVNNQNITCVESSVTLTAANSVTPNPVAYRWLNASGNIISTNVEVDANYGGTYTLELIDSISNCIVSEEVEVFEDIYPPYIDFPTNIYSLDCGNDFTQEIFPINADPWWEYWWEGPNGFFSDQAIIIVEEEGIYELTVTNFVNGCSSLEIIEVVDNGFVIDIMTTTATCDLSDGTATVSSGVANPLYEWSTGEQGNSITGLAQGWYSVTVTDLDNNCSKHENFFVDEDVSCKVVISGYVVIDSDSTCSYDPAMEGVELIMVRLNPLGIYTFTDSNGYYEFVVDDGDYSVQYISNMAFNLICPSPGFYNVSLDSNGTSDDDNHFFVQRVATDLCITKIDGNAVPGRNQFNLLEICNNGLLEQDAIVSFTHDDLFGQVANLPNIEPLNTNAEDYTYDPNNNTFTWVLENLYPGECRRISWFMETPVSAQVGAIINATAEVNPIDFEVNPSNNFLNWNRAVTASLDPNIKENYVGETLSGGAIYEEDTTMDYLIHFQNVGTDTAYTVVIRDTLDQAHLDITSLRGFTSSHDMEVEFEGTNILIFRFEDIYLVDSLTNEEESQGWVGFQIDLLSDLPIGTEVLNQAAIYFDFNEPIITNEIVNTIDQHFYKIEGSVNTEIGEGVKNVNVMLSGDLSASTLTDNTGEFSFTALNPNESFALAVEKNTNPWNGVTTQDIVAIRKHILGLELLDSPYKLLAADVNNSGSITALDIVLIRSLILLNIMEFPNNDSWKIIDGNFIFPDPTQPWNYSIPDFYAIDDISSDRYFNLIGIKMGDVNNTVQPWNLLDVDTRDKNGVYYLSVDNQIVSKGEELLVAFKAKDFDQLSAYQFTLDFDETKLIFSGFEEGVLKGMTDQNIGTRFLETGELTFAWTSPKGETVNDGEALFFLKFKARAEGQLDQWLAINSSKTAALAYHDDQDVFEVDLIFEEKNKLSKLEIFPNPANDNIFINMNLEQASFIQLDIFNAFGQIEKNILNAEKSAEGIFQQRINISDLSSGTYFVKIKISGELFVRKFIVI